MAGAQPPPDPRDAAAVAAFMSEYRRGGEQPFSSDAAGRDCRQLTKLYRKALKRSGVRGAERDRRTPDCRTLAVGLERATGRAPYWAECSMIAFEPARLDPCLEGLRFGGRVSTYALRDPDQRLQALEAGVRAARPNNKLPPTWRSPNPAALDRRTLECAAYERSPEHLERCLGAQLQTLASCAARRGAYEDRLRSDYGGMLPYGYRTLNCTQIEQAGRVVAASAPAPAPAPSAHPATPLPAATIPPAPAPASTPVAAATPVTGRQGKRPSLSAPARRPVPQTFGTPSVKPSPFARSGAVSPSSPAPAAPGTEDPNWPPGIGAGVAILVALAIGFGVVWWRQDDQQTQAKGKGARA